MKFEIQSRDRRALILLAAAAGIYLTASFLILPLFDQLAAGAGTVGQKEEDLRRYRRAAVARGHYTQLLDQAKKSVAEAESHLIRGDNPTLASVELQTIVEEAAGKLNIVLGPRNMTAARKKDAYFNEITMTLSFDGTLNQLTSFLAELRASSRFMAVRTLQLAPLQAATEAPAKGELKKTVKVTLTVSALLIAPAAEPKG